MNSEKTTQEHLEKGFKECECGHGVELLQAGFEIELHSCATCCRMVADRDEFFKLSADGASDVIFNATSAIWKTEKSKNGG